MEIEKFNIKEGPIRNKFYVLIGPENSGKTEVAARIAKWVHRRFTIEKCLALVKKDTQIVEKFSSEVPLSVAEFSVEKLTEFYNQQKTSGRNMVLILDNCIPENMWECHRILRLCLDSRTDANITTILSFSYPLYIPSYFSDRIDYIVLSGRFVGHDRESLIQYYKINKRELYDSIKGYAFMIIETVNSNGIAPLQTKYYYYHNRDGLLHSIMGYVWK